MCTPPWNCASPCSSCCSTRASSPRRWWGRRRPSRSARLGKIRKLISHNFHWEVIRCFPIKWLIRLVGSVALSSLSKVSKKVFLFFFYFFKASRGALRNHSPSAPTSPSSGKPLPFFDFRRGMGMDFGLQSDRKLLGRHRDWNPGPPAWESGVLAITLRGPPQTQLYFNTDFLKKREILKF